MTSTIDFAQLAHVHGGADDTGAAPQAAASPQTGWVMNQLQKSITTLAATPPTHSLWMIDPSDLKKR